VAANGEPMGCPRPEAQLIRAYRRASQHTFAGASSTCAFMPNILGSMAAVSRNPFTSDSEEWVQQQRITSTCALCGASIEALVPQAVAWFAQHRQTEHPNLPEPQHRRDRQRIAGTHPRS
jgi:hypothetical protein